MLDSVLRSEELAVSGVLWLAAGFATPELNALCLRERGY